MEQNSAFLNPWRHPDTLQIQHSDIMSARESDTKRWEMLDLQLDFGLSFVFLFHHECSWVMVRLTLASKKNLCYYLKRLVTGKITFIPRRTRRIALISMSRRAKTSATRTSTISLARHPANCLTEITFVLADFCHGCIFGTTRAMTLMIACWSSTWNLCPSHPFHFCEKNFSQASRSIHNLSPHTMH